MAKRVLLGYESRHEPLLGQQGVRPSGRWPEHGAAAALVALSLAAGMIGYHSLEGMAWVDAFANAAMILSGMGPLALPQRRGAGRCSPGCTPCTAGWP